MSCCANPCPCPPLSSSSAVRKRSATFVIADWTINGAGPDFFLNIIHSLNTQNIVVEVFDSTDNVVIVDTFAADVNTVRLEVPNIGTRFDGRITIIG